MRLVQALHLQGDKTEGRWDGSADSPGNAITAAQCMLHIQLGLRGANQHKTAAPAHLLVTADLEVLAALQVGGGRGDSMVSTCKYFQLFSSKVCLKADRWPDNNEWCDAAAAPKLPEQRSWASACCHPASVLGVAAAAASPSMGWPHATDPCDCPPNVRSTDA